MDQQDSPPTDPLLPHFEVVWMTSAHTGLPHCKEFTAANPLVIQHRCDSPEASGDERVRIWRNCDRHIRNWWKASRHLVKSQHVIFLEWDVVCNVPLDRILSVQEGLVCSRIKRQHNPEDSWYWFREVPNLPAAMQASAIGVVPLAVLQLTREALDALCEECHDELFTSDIYCEMRTPTLLQ
ncbi:MAG: hypothetical protein CFE26_08560, partial [Verrucomicrobiales bacterium VVV1]